MVDLHTHSVFSDGTFTPEELVDTAEKAGIRAIALCDHNSVAGLRRFMNAAIGKSVATVPGAEFSVDYLNKELHLLALFIGAEFFDEITGKMNVWKKKKEECNIILGDALRNLGIDINVRRMIEDNPHVVINRAHIGAELVRLGYVNSVSEAFEKWLSKEKGLYIEPSRPDVFEMIGYISRIGALPVLAHPFLNLNRDELSVFLPKARACGLVGIEALYPLFSEEESALACDLAREHGLLLSGGSDFHGKNKPSIRLGVGKGDLCVADEIYYTLLSEYKSKLTD